jgi:O-acetyl-ADP-ribose deacetylase (regulator of RNase III)
MPGLTLGSWCGSVEDVTAEPTWQLGHRSIVLTRGDITRFPADAIVNAANEHLRGGGGVDGAIHRVGGPTIMAELEARYGPDRHCPTGRAVVTGAGRLPARWVIHAVGPRWRGGRSGEAELLRSAYRAALELAERLGAHSIAFPAISCGVYGYPAADAATVAVATVAEHLRVATVLTRATFVLSSAETFDAFAAALERAAQAD